MIKNPDDYRPGVGIYLFNNKGHVFVAQRIDKTSEAWQMPQGGIDEGEEPLDALYRELMEEVGISAEKVTLVHELDDWLYYDLPEHLQKILWKGRYKGQRQKWYALKYIGTDADINIATETPEFSHWKWASPADLPGIIVDFKRELYAELLEKFKLINS